MLLFIDLTLEYYNIKTSLISIIKGDFTMKKNILLIHTGGTISMQINNETGSVLPSDSNPIMGLSSNLEKYANITELEAFNLPSPHITPNEMLQLRNLLVESTRNSPVDGVVITHGTDTLEETAYFLRFNYKL